MKKAIIYDKLYIPAKDIDYKTVLNHYIFAIKRKKADTFTVSTYSYKDGGETRSRTQINGFGDRCSTIELFPHTCNKQVFNYKLFKTLFTRPISHIPL